MDSIGSALAAVRGGASRLEVCAQLSVGGLTPSGGFLMELRERVRTPLAVMIRPRAGDFHYSADELRVMERDIDLARAAGADCVVFGVLTRDGRVDRPRTAALVDRARPLEVTFHRAVDYSRDPAAAIEALVEAGVDRVLSAGGARSAPSGWRMLRAMVARSAGRIQVVAGGGIHGRNVAALVARTGVDAVHLSGSVPMRGTMRFVRRDLRTQMGESEVVVTRAERVALVVKALKR